jgi:hypothetical protein
MVSYNKMVILPRRTSIEMVLETIKRHNGKYSPFQLWKRLPKKMMYQAFRAALEQLRRERSITVNGQKKICIIQIPEEPLHDANRESILASLSQYGYDLVRSGIRRTGSIIPLEDLVIEILIRFPEARFIEAIPLLLVKNRLNTFELYRKAYQTGLINQLGFLTEVAISLARKLDREKPALQSLLDHLRAAMCKRTSALGRTDLQAKHTPRGMKRWRLKGHFVLEDFAKEAYQ